MTSDPEKLGPYLRYRPDVEVTQPHEAEDVAALREIFAEIRSFAFEKHRHGMRDAHAKSHGVLSGTLRVHDGLPAELRQGLFAHAGDHPVIIRYSTAPGDVVPDGSAPLAAWRSRCSTSTVRRCSPIRRGRGPRTSSWSTIRRSPPATCTPTVATRRCWPRPSKQPEEMQLLATSLLRAGAGLLRRAGIDRTGGPAGQAKPHTHLLGETYYSQGALRFGDHVAKVAAAPVSDNLTALTGQHVPVLQSSALRDLTSSFFADQQASGSCGSSSPPTSTSPRSRTPPSSGPRASRPTAPWPR